MAGADLHAWLPRPSGPVRFADESDAPLGAAVALGPADASDERIQHAVTELTSLVKAGGVVAAGAGVDLGGGFHSARLLGAREDRRDAVLAALKVVGLEGADRLGDRAGFLVALFGPEVTKPVGVAAAQAISEGRWAALHLASAASDVLGPEQLEQVLALTAPNGVDLMENGQASVLAGHLTQVLEPVPGPRRLPLLVDLWAQVCAHHARLARREHLLATQGRRSRVDDLQERRERHEDELILWQVRASLNDLEPSLADAARWAPPDQYWYGLLNRILQDALAATALLRTAVAISDHGLADGLARSKTLICVAAAQIPDLVATASARKVPGLTGLPARPGGHVREIHNILHRDGPADAKFEAYVRQRLARAHDYAVVVIEKIEELLVADLQVPEAHLLTWAATDLRHWREKIGYTSVRPPAEWDAIPLGVHHPPAPGVSLADRLEDLRDPVIAEVETVGDLLWYADLADALAQLYGHEAAKLTRQPGLPWFNHDPPEAPPAPLAPRLDSITLAVAGAAQLVALGGTPARSAKSWVGFIDGLRADTAIAEVLNGEFSIPAPLAAVDGTTVPGTGARIKFARNARMLAEWSDYMGNCIASPHYLEDAVKGRCGLAALYEKNNRILVNVDLRPGRPATRGWRVDEILARFNNAPDEDLEKRFRRWVATIPGSEDANQADPPSPDEVRADRPIRRRAPHRLLQETGPALVMLAERAWADQITDEVLNTLGVLAKTAPAAGLTRLRRLGSGQLTQACRSAIETGALDLIGLWTVTGIRPLETAVDALDPAVRQRFEQLTLLLDDVPLPASLRKLVKMPALAPTHSMGLVGRRVRAAIGQLVYDGDPVIAQAISRGTTPPLLCALMIMVTCRAPAVDLTPLTPPGAVAVPGFPATSLDDENGPWSRALPAARELGANIDVFRDQVAEHGLRIPTSWLGAGGWTALWSGAHNTRRS